MDSFFMLIHVDVAVNNTELFSVALETQQWIPFYACQQYKIVQCCLGNTTMDSNCTVIELENLSSNC